MMSRYARRVFAAAIAGALAFGALDLGAQSEPADLVLLNGRIVTVDPDRPEAQAVAARGQWIVAVGSDQEIRAHIGPQTQVIDLEGRLAIPGFVEGHGHFLGLGSARDKRRLANPGFGVGLLHISLSFARWSRICPSMQVFKLH
jgi:cytosine/adenosine deaminase-related metal-dependent hydrolase